MGVEACARSIRISSVAAMPIRVLWAIKGLGPGGAERLLVEAARTHDRLAFEIHGVFVRPDKDHLAGVARTRRRHDAVHRRKPSLADAAVPTDPRRQLRRGAPALAGAGARGQVGGPELSERQATGPRHHRAQRSLDLSPDHTSCGELDQPVGLGGHLRLRRSSAVDPRPCRCSVRPRSFTASMSRRPGARVTIVRRCVTSWESVPMS